MLAAADPPVVEVPEFRAAGTWAPTGRTRRGTRTRAPWRAPSPRRGGRRRKRRRTGAPRSHRAAPSSGGGSCAHRPGSSDPPGVDGFLHRGDDQLLSHFRDAPVAELDHLVEVVPGVHVHDGKGDRAGQNAFSASRSMTMESLPPEKSSTGRSNSAATSRITGSTRPRGRRAVRAGSRTQLQSLSSHQTGLVAGSVASLVSVRCQFAGQVRPGQRPVHSCWRPAATVRRFADRIAASSISAIAGRQTRISGSRVRLVV